jgi:hypothetical protein
MCTHTYEVHALLHVRMVVIDIGGNLGCLYDFISGVISTAEVIYNQM